MQSQLCWPSGPASQYCLSGLPQIPEITGAGVEIPAGFPLQQKCQSLPLVPITCCQKGAHSSKLGRRDLLLQWREDEFWLRRFG